MIWPEWVASAPDYGHVLYRLYDAEDQLLYIGLSGAPRNRLKAHWRKQPWRHEVVRSTFQQIPPPAPGQVIGRHKYFAEEAAIKAEQPKYNVAGISRPYWVYDL